MIFFTFASSLSASFTKIDSGLETDYLVDDPTTDTISTVSIKTQTGKVSPLRNFSLEYAKYALSFSGSGTTAISAKKLGRRYLGFEISKEYFDISQKRIKKLETLEKIEQTSKKFFDYDLDNSK